jgi:hypothetical protein
MNARQLLAVTLLLAACFTSASVEAAIQTFDSPGDVTLGPTQAPGTWYTDRFAPAGFAAGQTAPDGQIGTLKQSIDGSQVQANSFYNYQGRKYDINLTGAVQAVSIGLYVDPSWATNDVNAGIWLTGFDSTPGEVSAYPIIAYRHSSTASAGFYTWDYVNGGWINDPAVGPGWHTLTTKLIVGTGMESYVDGVLFATFADPDTVSLGNVILNSYNYGQSYDVYWDNLSTATVPEPATLIVWSLLGATTWLGMRVWRGGQRLGGRSWSPENRQAILDIIDRSRSH